MLLNGKNYSMSMVKISLSGSSGRMGIAIENLIKKQPKKFKLISKFARISNMRENDLSSTYDVIVDFSHSDNLEKLLKIATSSKTPIVIGTTGFTTDHMQKIKEASLQIPILYAPNTSIGANLVAYLSAKAAKILEKYDVEIVEAHHRYKKDAPSGTALMIGKRIAEAKNVNFDDVAVFERASKKSARAQDEIGFSSIRGGGIFGDNEVIFAGDNEVINISTRALSRDVFAEGALLAAQWVIEKEANGLYSMQDVF